MATNIENERPLNSKRTVIFYFPFHKIGGVSILFLRIAQALSDEYSVYIADYSDGYMARNITNNINLISIDGHVNFPKNSIFIFQSFLPWRFPFLSKVDPSSKILFWNLHPNNFNYSIFNENSEFAPWKIIAKLVNLLAIVRRNKTREIINYLLKNRALVFMDSENLRATEEIFGKKIEVETYLPVATPPLNLRQKHVVDSNSITFAWIGRLADFKYKILEHLIQRLSKLDFQNKLVTLIIIGDGDFKEYLMGVARRLNNVDLKIIFLGELSSSELHTYLSEKVDIVFSMGASALEAASMGIPVFLADYSYSNIKRNYKFSMLYEKPGFCLGEKITNKNYENECTLKASIINVIKNYDHYSTLSFQYWRQNFSIDIVSDSLIVQIEASSASFDEMNERGYFTSDKFGQIMRSIGWWLRKRNSFDVEGFRHDC